MEGRRKSDPAVRRSRWNERDLSWKGLLSVACVCVCVWELCVGGRRGVVRAISGEQLLLLHMAEMCLCTRVCGCL